jgi:hypothetical protein
MVTRSRHPLVGRRLQVIGAMRRLGRNELLVVLPDGSKTLIPAAWIDRDITAVNGDQALDQGTAILTGPVELLHAGELVASLCARADVARGQAARKSPCKEDDRAACAAESDARTDPGATTGSDRVVAGDGGRRRDQDSGRLIASAAATTMTGVGDE